MSDAARVKHEAAKLAVHLATEAVDTADAVLHQADRCIEIADAITRALEMIFDALSRGETITDVAVTKRALHANAENLRLVRSGLTEARVECTQHKITLRKITI
jgi:hypothetical protein